MGAASTSELCKECASAAPLVCLNDIWTYLPGGKIAYRRVSSAIGMVSKQYCLYGDNHVSYESSQPCIFMGIIFYLHPLVRVAVASLALSEFNFSVDGSNLGGDSQ